MRKRRRHDTQEVRTACYPVRFPQRVGGVARHHATSDGMWLKIAKKGSGIETVSLAEAIEVALCYGWIGSQANSFDDEYWLLRFTPRRPRSNWSKVNRGKVKKLIEEDRMKPAGLREVERAKAEGPLGGVI